MMMVMVLYNMDLLSVIVSPPVFTPSIHQLPSLSVFNRLLSYGNLIVAETRAIRL